MRGKENTNAKGSEMVTMRHGNTAREIIASGAWAKIGHKTYRHVSGAVVAFDCTAWGWRINDEKWVWPTLWVACEEVEWSSKRT